MQAHIGPRLSILTGYLAEQLTDALTAFDIPMSCVVTRQETTGPEWDPVITPVPYACSGWVDDYDAAEHVDSNVLVSDRKVYVVASTLAIVPTPSDAVTIGGATYSIISVQRDPAGTAWVCQCRI